MIPMASRESDGWRLTLRSGIEVLATKWYLFTPATDLLFGKNDGQIDGQTNEQIDGKTRCNRIQFGAKLIPGDIMGDCWFGLWFKRAGARGNSLQLYDTPG